MTFQVRPIDSLDVMLDTSTGALLTEDTTVQATVQTLQAAMQAPLLAAGPSSKVKASGTLIPSSASTPQAFPAAPAGTKRMVIAPLMNSDGSAANTSVCFLRENATNTAAGAPIRPTDGLVNINTTDPTQFFLKVITQGDGLYYLCLGD